LSAPTVLLLDTHAWVWMAFGDTSHFSRKTIARVEEVARGGHMLLAAISLWEVAMLESKGRLRLSPSCEEFGPHYRRYRCPD
jgi:PIN domain nuclease of toxin-antitoxin system